MKKSIIAIALCLASVSAFAADHNDYAGFCMATAYKTKSGEKTTFAVQIAEHSEREFVLVDSINHFSIFSPKMFRDPNTGGYVGTTAREVYRANYVAGKDMFDLISADFVTSVVCDR